MVAEKKQTTEAEANCQHLNKRQVCNLVDPLRSLAASNNLINIKNKNLLTGTTKVFTHRKFIFDGRVEKAKLF